MKEWVTIVIFFDLVESRGGYVSENLYVKTKELGPLGGRRVRPSQIRQWIRVAKFWSLFNRHMELNW